MNDRQKQWRALRLIEQPDAWANEDEALDLAYAITDRARGERTLRRIADAMTAAPAC